VAAQSVTTIGAWTCRLAADSGTWAPVPVPGSWEQAGIAIDHPGPVEYRTRIDIPSDAAGRTVTLRFGAVSYACEIFVNGEHVGSHIGMWDPFDIDISDAVDAGSSAQLLVRIEKPASLTGGPDAPPVPGSYPTRQTFAGFLPYVWGHTHGGIWQPVELFVADPRAITSMTVQGEADGTITGTVSLTTAVGVQLEVSDPDGWIAASTHRHGSGPVDFTLRVPNPSAWSPASPALYTVTARTDDGESRNARIGLRTFNADGPRLQLNGQPIYPRMVLSWGWYPDRLHPDPGPDRVRTDLTELRRLGFNGVKLCLWFPPPYYFDVADELGMLLWLELPMWLPEPTEQFRRQLFTESERLITLAAAHPSLILITLGCELSSVVGADVLGPLYDMAKRLAPQTLVRDNSGSGEAYGGLLDEFADFDDHHLYCEPAYIKPTMDHFSPRWRQPRPWLFGEFCDYDTYRDLSHAQAADRPWWTSPDPQVNPQGARWQYDVPYQEERLISNGFWARGADLTELSHRQALLHRKITLEAVRIRSDTSGYVITGERDTPISTSGLWDDSGNLKVDSSDFVAFNSDLTLCLDWDRRRTWIAGGDRPAPWDTWCYRSDSLVRSHIVLAHHGATGGSVDVEWDVTFPDSAPFAYGRLHADAPAGQVTGLGIAQFSAPSLVRPRRAVLTVRAKCAGTTTENCWPMWILPDNGWGEVGPVALIDPTNVLGDLKSVKHNRAPVGDTVAVLIATNWTAEVSEHLNAGGNAVLLLATPGPSHLVHTDPMPFWRECVKVIEPHEAWGTFPHDGWTDLQFTGLATDMAMARPQNDSGYRPILSRVDNRTGLAHDYAAELRHGTGRLIVSTLRFDGSLGDQPLGLQRNTAAAYLLGQWVTALRQPEPDRSRTSPEGRS
jgi:hypothetical protein